MSEIKKCIVCHYTILSIYNKRNMCGPCREAGKNKNEPFDAKVQEEAENVYIRIEVDVGKIFPGFPEYNQEHIIRYILHYLGVPYRRIARMVSRDHKLIMRSYKKVRERLKKDEELKNKIKGIIERNKVEGYH